MSKLSERINVNNMAAFNNALNDEYGVVIVTGDAYEEVRSALKNHLNMEWVSRGLRWLTIPLLFVSFPAAVAALFVSGLTSDNINKYIPNINSNNSITLTHKKSRV